MEKVFAVIVTFKRPELLKQCIIALMAQRKFGLSRIHIVVNSDDNETIEVIKSCEGNEHLITFEKFDNPGPAGGFYFGLKQFIEEDCEWVWLMDDDVIVKDNCLQELLTCAKTRDYIFPKVIKGNGQEVVSFGWWGPLIARSLVQRAGLPVPELFFWAEDTEYLQNRLMRIYGVSPLRCQTAIVEHLHERKKKRPSWYYYYSVRNTLYYRTYITGYNWHRIKRTLYLLPQSFFTIVLKEDRKLKKIALMALGIFHGLRGKIGKLVDPVTNK